MAAPKKPTMITSPLVANGEKNVIPQDTPLGSNAFSVNAGFPPITATPIQAGGIPPDRLDFNGVFNLLSQHTFFLESGNKYEWNNKLDYMFGATVLGSDNALYYCIQANGVSEPNTIQDPVSSSGYWVKLVNSDGKINADNLSVTLGVFALLNSISLTDNKMTGQLPSTKLADNAVTTAKIANGSVTNEKITNIAASKVTGLARVATTGNYNDLASKPNIPTSGIMPKSTASPEIGQVIYINNKTNTTLPAGGTWLYFWGDVANYAGRMSFAAGGSQIALPAFLIIGWAWRIA